jgi:transcriptional regulator with XRE-family HTH domain
MGNFRVKGEEIRKLREVIGWTGGELAERVGTHMQVLYRIEQGREKPSMSLLTDFARALGVPVSELIEVEQTSSMGFLRSGPIVMDIPPELVEPFIAIVRSHKK